MRETPDEVLDLELLMERSHAASSETLRGIITDRRTLTARNVVDLLSGMRVLSVATVTSHGEPRISALDGHFLHATWTFSTSAASVKARHLAERPAVSVAHIDGEQMALFAHGRVERLHEGGPWWDDTLDHWITHYGSSPVDWADEVAMYRLRPTWMVGYAADPVALLASRGLASD